MSDENGFDPHGLHLDRVVSRRRVIQGGGALFVWFSLAACGAPAATPAAQPSPVGTPRPTPAAPATAVKQEQKIQQPTPTPGEAQAPSPASELDSWLAIAADGSVTVFSGKVELGTGVQTALAQIAADELNVPFERIKMVMGDTAETPNEGYTAGSQTIQSGGVAIRQASAEAKRVLLDLASQRLGAPADQLTVKDGVVSLNGNAGKSISYGELVGGKRFNHVVPKNVPTESPSAYTIVGKSIPRVDLPGKIDGSWEYVENLRPEGMLHGRIIRQPGVGATLQSVDESSIQNVPGVVKVVRNGSFLGVVAEREEQAIQATRQLKATWDVPGNLPAQADLYNYILKQPTDDKVVHQKGDAESGIKGAAKVIGATYQQPYQAHASIGPSCAVADVKPGAATVWSSTQGVYPLRGALAQLLGMPEDQVRVIHLEGAGCYGHNGFDDAAADAALLSRAVGKPVRVQWMRQDEFALEPKGPAMQMQLKAGLDSQGKVVGWLYDVWTPTHSTRPGGQAGNLRAGTLISPPAPAAKNPPVGGDRDAPTTYTFANQKVTAHWLPESASFLRPSALRTLGGLANSFANESFMDELAVAAAVDPIDFRLRHLDDPRAIAVIKDVAAKANWQPRAAPTKAAGTGGTATGRGFAFVRYETTGAYMAAIADVAVNRDTGQVTVQKLTVSHDCGLIINPDGLTNQIEGNCIQATSRTLKEQITWDQSGVTSLDWRGYPILTFPEVPDVVVSLIDHPDEPAWGAGEPTTAVIPPAIANAIFDAAGARVRTVPFTAERVKAALTSA